MTKKKSTGTPRKKKQSRRKVNRHIPAQPITSATATNNLIVIPKEDVESMNMKCIINEINKLKTNHALLLNNHNTYDIYFDGYQDDPRPNFKIQEIKDWFDASIKDNVPWFYLLSLQNYSLQTVLQCSTQVEYIEIPGKGEFIRYNHDNVDKWVKLNLNNLGMFVNENKISVSIRNKIANAVCEVIISELKNRVTDESTIKEIDDFYSAVESSRQMNKYKRPA
jgi:hypothetical protein